MKRFVTNRAKTNQNKSELARMLLLLCALVCLTRVLRVVGSLALCTRTVPFGSVQPISLLTSTESRRVWISERPHNRVNSIDRRTAASDYQLNA